MTANQEKKLDKAPTRSEVEGMWGKQKEMYVHMIDKMYTNIGAFILSARWAILIWRMAVSGSTIRRVRRMLTSSTRSASFLSMMLGLREELNGTIKSLSLTVDLLFLGEARSKEKTLFPKLLLSECLLQLNRLDQIFQRGPVPLRLSSLGCNWDVCMHDVIH